MKLTNLTAGLIVLATSGCLLSTDEPELSEDSFEVTGGNKLGLNKLGLNKLGLNKLGLNKLGLNSLETQSLLSTADGREVFSYVVSCALNNGTSITAQDGDGVSYTFSGWLGLAPNWATKVPTVSERRWVTACLLARTNVFGVPVDISMRHDTNLKLTSSSTERTKYNKAEGAFYGDLFTTSQAVYACGNRSWTSYQPETFRACALSQNGYSTDCNFTYTGPCSSSFTCNDTTPPFGSCKGGGTSYSEVITIFLTSTQQQGDTQ